MPQMKIEKKFFRVRVDKILQNIAQIISEKPAVAEFQSNPKNLTGGEK